jgi:AcrR family transcriptional regulator
VKDTKTKILDAAEKIIMELGAEKASLRKITQEAGVNIAAINYYFGSKNNLVSAIMARIISPLMEDLKAGLASVMATAGEGKPTIEAIIRAYLIPLLEFSRKHPDYENMFMQLFQSYDNEDGFRQSIRGLSGQVTNYYGECFIKALPELSQRTVLARMAFFRNTAIGVMEGNCLMEESLAVLGLEMEETEMTDAMVAFLAAGFRG